MKRIMVYLVISCFVVLLDFCTNQPEQELSRLDSLFNDAEPVVAVRVINTLDKIRIKFHAQWKIRESDAYFNSGDGIVVSQKDMNVVAWDKSGNEILSSEYFEIESGRNGDELEIADVPYGVGWWWEGKENRLYEGLISIYPGPAGVPEVIVTLPMEEYLKGVVPYEIGPDSPIEALKAQAIAARSEAVVALRSDMYRGPNHDLTSDVECQVFSGNARRSQYSDQAVNETRGIILSSDGKPINAYYASNCGGHSELIKNVWPDRERPLPYTLSDFDGEPDISPDLQNEADVKKWIESKPDVNCNPENDVELPEWSRNNFRWERSYSLSDVSAMLNPSGELGSLIAILPQERGTSGRIIKSIIKFENGEITTTSELELRQLFKPSLRSSCFVSKIESGNLILNGAGWGHGVGMCQSGAVAMALKNAAVFEILNKYYPEADISLAY